MGDQADRMNFVYILRCSDDTLYCGWTNNLAKRIAAHNAGTGAKYTRSRRPVELLYFEECRERKEAMSKEWHYKRMSRGEKMKMITKSSCGENSDDEQKEQ